MCVKSLDGNHDIISIYTHRKMWMDPTALQVVKEEEEEAEGEVWDEEISLNLNDSDDDEEEEKQD